MLHHRIYKAMDARAISEVTLFILFYCFRSPIFGRKSQNLRVYKPGQGHCRGQADSIDRVTRPAGDAGGACLSRHAFDDAPDPQTHQRASQTRLSVRLKGISA
jgi:hypothetical protein